MLKSKIEKLYEKHDCGRGCQGDIIRDIKIPRIVLGDKVEELSLPYVVLLSQDCDLDKSVNGGIVDAAGIKKNNQYLPNVLILPAFTSESVRDGKHLKGLFDIIQDRIHSDIWKKVTQNNEDRYHFLNSYRAFQIPDLIIDFKIYFSIEYSELIKFYNNGGYLGTINELFRERLSQRFTNYLARIGLPDNLEQCSA